MEYLIKVSVENSGKRLDLFLLEYFQQQQKGFSRTFIQKLITEGKVRLGDNSKLKPHQKVKEADELVVLAQVPEAAGLVAEKIALEIIYEDDDLAVLNKPIGLVVHPAPGNYEHTLVNALMYHFKDLSNINPARPGIVHRLDKDTSGLLVIAKTNFAHLALAKQFSEHSIKRQYVAVVKGEMEFDENVIELPIGRHPVKRKSMAVGFSENTKYAKTYYRTVKRANGLSLLELEPFTGRTHQLRVHLSYIGHPILGDKKYGNNNRFARLCLHAKSIGFLHPRTEKWIEFSCDAPVEFKELLKKGRKQDLS
ncbi:MAG: RluA family pseudouridine synthase [Candidatus Omnitrophica bacterium]|nr:RluA family pseudouridine synthase [Candidatus Omnitrophota bacterium]